MQTVNIDKVDASDKQYSVSYPLEDDLLLSSVARFGLLNPIALLSAEHPVIVMGFKRMEAARRLGIREIPCLFLDVDEKRALLAAISDNIGRSLNTIEKIRCVERMCALKFPTAEIHELLKMIGLPAREKTLEIAVAAAPLQDRVKMFIVDHRLPITAIEQLLWFDVEERDRIVEITNPLDVTVSSLRETLQLMMLVKVRRGRVDFRQLAEADNMAGLKQTLKQVSHPLLCELERKLVGVLKSCALPPNLKIHIDPFFEKDWIDVSIRARDISEMNYALKKLDHLLAEGLLGSLLDLTHGLPIRN